MLDEPDPTDKSINKLEMLLYKTIMYELLF